MPSDSQGDTATDMYAWGDYIVPARPVDFMKGDCFTMQLASEKLAYPDALRLAHEMPKVLPQTALLGRKGVFVPGGVRGAPDVLLASRGPLGPLPVPPRVEKSKGERDA